jgi:hypothetical protein
MKVREVIKVLEGEGWRWPERRAVTGSITIRRNRERLLLQAIRQWTFLPER